MSKIRSKNTKAKFCLERLFSPMAIGIEYIATPCLGSQI
nr:hypothetical protein [Dyadobacter fermentans]